MARQHALAMNRASPMMSCWLSPTVRARRWTPIAMARSLPRCTASACSPGRTDAGLVSGSIQRL